MADTSEWLRDVDAACNATADECRQEMEGTAVHTQRMKCLESGLLSQCVAVLGDSAKRTDGTVAKSALKLLRNSCTLLEIVTRLQCEHSLVSVTLDFIQSHNVAIFAPSIISEDSADPIIQSSR